MPLQNIAHGLVADGVPQVLQSPRNPIIALAPVFLDEAHHQCL